MTLSAKLWVFYFVFIGSLLAHPPKGEFPLADGGDALFQHIVEVRGRPVTEVETTQTLNARDFGAVPDDAKDDLSALRAVFAQAAKDGKTMVKLEAGVYHLRSVADDENAFVINGAQDVVIDGEGAELVNTNPKSAFFNVVDCERLVLRNFIADYDPPAFTQGKVVGVDRDNQTFDYEVQEGFPLADKTFFENRTQIFGFLMDNRPEFRGRMKPGAPHAIRVRNPVVLGTRTVRLQTDFKIRFVEVGDLFVQLARSGSTHWVLYDRSRDVTFQNITIHAAGAAVFIGGTSDRINILNCKVIPRGDRLISANGGGSIAQAFGQGIWVEGCRFESLSDDPVNFYSKPIYIPKAGEEGSALHLWPVLPGRLAAGDEVAFFDPREGKTISRAKVATFGNGIATFDPPIDVSQLNLAGDTSERSRETLKKHDFLINLRLLSDYYVVKDNEFINCRGRLLVRCSRGVIEGNTVRGSGMGGLVMQNDWVTPEGYQVRDVVVRNNTFDECGLTTDEQGMSSIVFSRIPRGDDPFDAPSDWREHANVLIRGNTFKNWARNPALSVHGIERLWIVDNTFAQDSRHPYFPGADTAVITIANSDSVTIRGNLNDTSAKKFVNVSKDSGDVKIDEATHARP